MERTTDLYCTQCQWGTPAKPSVKLCPLHAAAEEMREMLAAAIEAIGVKNYTREKRLQDVLNQARALLAKVGDSH